jgi:superoxide dismutase
VVTRGIPGLFSKKGFQTAYTDYEQHMIDELNASTSGMSPRSVDADLTMS